LYRNNGKNDPAVFNWIADGQKDAVNIIEKTIREIREDIRNDLEQQGYVKEDIEDILPGTKEWYKDSRGRRYYCCLCIDECYYEFYITNVEDKTKNFFWDCK
jgi:hypothetical protein